MPDEESLYRIVQSGGVDAAIVDEKAIERIANELSWTGRPAESKRMFEFLERLQKITAAP